MTPPRAYFILLNLSPGRSSAGWPRRPRLPTATISRTIKGRVELRRGEPHTGTIRATLAARLAAPQSKGNSLQLGTASGNHPCVHPGFMPQEQKQQQNLSHSELTQSDRNQESVALRRRRI